MALAWRKGLTSPGPVKDRRRADELNERGRVMADHGQLDEAAKLYRQAVTVDPELAAAWFNLGLVHKWRREWPAAVECNLRSVELTGDEGDPAWWNLGIAATALRRWELARRAWQCYGVPLPEGNGPVDVDFGLTPVRLNPGGEAEIVWCARIDPARAVVRNIPLPRSGHRWGDVILHDGSFNGERVLDGVAYGVFGELERWEPSTVPTLQVDALCTAEGDAERLVTLFEDAGYTAEDWTRSVVALCATCSTGTADTEHDHTPEEWNPERSFGLAAPRQAAGNLLRSWEQESRRSSHPGPAEVVA
jgi:hypothetical protein